MARPRQFERETVVERSLDVFWQQGFEATSVDDLVTATGLGRQSLYNAFGDKRQLYREALQTYCSRENDRLADVLDGDGPILPRLRGVVEAITEATISDDEARGCFAVNAGVEAADEPARELVERQYAVTTERFTDALTRAQALGELAPGQDPGAIARLLVLVISGVRATGRAGLDPESLRAGAGVALALLAGPATDATSATDSTTSAEPTT